MRRRSSTTRWRWWPTAVGQAVTTSPEYAVELALKACIAKAFKAVTIPDKDLVNATYSHNFGNLAGTAGLSADLRSREQADAKFAANWGVVTSWSPDARYAQATQQQAVELLQAIRDEDNGVLPWIKAFW